MWLSNIKVQFICISINLLWRTKFLFLFLVGLTWNGKEKEEGTQNGRGWYSISDTACLPTPSDRRSLPVLYSCCVLLYELLFMIRYFVRLAAHPVLYHRTLFSMMIRVSKDILYNFIIWKDILHKNSLVSAPSNGFSKYSDIVDARTNATALYTPSRRDTGFCGHPCPQIAGYRADY